MMSVSKKEKERLKKECSERSVQRSVMVFPQVLQCVQPAG